MGQVPADLTGKKGYRSGSPPRFPASFGTTILPQLNNPVGEQFDRLCFVCVSRMEIGSLRLDPLQLLPLRFFGVLFLLGIMYYLFTQDAPHGTFGKLRNAGFLPPASRASGLASFGEATRDPRVGALFVVYAACFGIELTINNVAALYFHDRFALDVKTAGLVAGLFGLPTSSPGHSAGSARTGAHATGG